MTPVHAVAAGRLVGLFALLTAETHQMAAAGPALPTLAPAERHVVRGIYDADEDPDFDGAVRSFATKDESEAWYATKQRCTNPDYPQCRHIYTTLCDWEQVNKYLLRPLAEYRAAYPVKPADAGAVSGNVFVGEAVIRRELTARLDLPFHARTTEESTLNTLRYMFYHMKCGIFAMVRRNRVVMFVPFVNKDYTNTWAHKMTMEYGSVEEFARHKVHAGTGSVRGSVGVAGRLAGWLAGGACWRPFAREHAASTPTAACPRYRRSRRCTRVRSTSPTSLGGGRTATSSATSTRRPFGGTAT